MANLDELRRLLAEHDAGGGYVLTLANAVPALLDRIAELEAERAEWVNIGEAASLQRILELEAALDYCDRAVDDIGCMDDQCNQARLDVQAKVAALRGKENTDA